MGYWCHGEIRTVKIRTVKIRTVRIRTVKIRTVKIRTDKIRTARIRTDKIRTVKIRTLTTRAQNVRRLRTVTEIVIAYLSTVRKFEFLRYGNPEIEQEAQLLPHARMTASCQ